MPAYRFNCPLCGPFDQMRPLALFADPCNCPSCGQQAERALALPMRGATGAALAPAVLTLAHTAGCACCAPKARGPSRPLAALSATPAPVPGFLSGA